MVWRTVAIAFLVGATTFARDTCDRELAGYGFLRLGPEIARGNGGRVHPIEDGGAPPDSVVKVFEDRDGNATEPAEAARLALAYRRGRELFGENAVEYRGFAEVEPGRFGVTMSRLPEEIRESSVDRFSDRTVADLHRIKETLLANELYLFDFQFTVDRDGRVILYDFDGLASWNPADPLYRGKSEDFGRARVLANLDGYIRYVERKLDARAASASR